MQFRKLLLLLPAIFVAACSTPQVAPTVTELPQSGVARGIDMPTDSSDVFGELQGRPWLHFVARYYRDPSSRWPALTASEAQRLSAAGYKIVTVWEWHSSDPAYFTYASGYNDALSAARQAKTVGQPAGSAIYFAVDFNARGSALYQVDQYFRGVNAGLVAAGGGRPEYKVGVYGSGAVCAQIRGTGLAHYAWLTGSTAWDGTAGYNGWNIRQAAQGGRFPSLSFSHDANEARNDYGGFQLGNYANATTPAAAVVTAAAAVPAAAAGVVAGTVAAIVPAPASSPPPAASAVTAAAPPSPPARPAAVAAAAPLPAAPPAPAPTPPPGGNAAEVAALAAAEPAARASPRAVAEPEGRSSEKTASEERPHEHMAARAPKGSAAPKRKILAVAASRAVVAAPRHSGGPSLARSRELEHRTSTQRRAEEHTAHAQGGKAGPVRVLDQPAKRNAEQHRHERSRHAADT